MAGRSERATLEKGHKKRDFVVIDSAAATYDRFALVLHIPGQTGRGIDHTGAAMRRSHVPTEYGTEISRSFQILVIDVCLIRIRSPKGESQATTHRPRILRSEEHTSELQSPYDLVCRLLLEKK